MPGVNRECYSHCKTFNIILIQKPIEKLQSFQGMFLWFHKKKVRCHPYILSTYPYPIIHHRLGHKTHFQNHWSKLSPSYMHLSSLYKSPSSLRCGCSTPYQFESGEPSSSSSLKRADLWLSEYPSYVIILAS